MVEHNKKYNRHQKWEITLDVKQKNIQNMPYLCSAPHTSDPSLEMSVLSKLENVHLLFSLIDLARQVYLLRGKCWIEIWY